MRWLLEGVRPAETLLNDGHQVVLHTRSADPQPIDRVISLINPMRRGWVNYFAVGHSSECFSYIKDEGIGQRRCRRQRLELPVGYGLDVGRNLRCGLADAW